MATLRVGGNSIALPDTFAWIDEFGWSPVKQTTKYSCTGTLLVQRGVKKAGRTMTLGGRGGASQRSIVAALYNSLTFDGDLVVNWLGTDYNVLWDQENPIETSTLLDDLADPDLDDWYWLTLRFIIV